MKKTLVTTALINIMAFATVAFAVQSQSANQSLVKVTSVSQQSPSGKKSRVVLYSGPNKKKKIQSLPVWSRLVVILRKGNWVKVGNPQDGTVGWVNIPEWRQAQQQAIHLVTDTESFSINKQGDKLVVYKDGKKLANKEAQQFYQRWQSQQVKQQRQMRHYFRDFDRMMYWDMRHMQDMFEQPLWMPGPVIQPKGNKPHTTDKKKVSV